VKAELERLTQEWTSAWLDHDVVAVDGLMGPKFVYVAADGQVLDRQVMLSIVRSPSYRLAWGARTEVSVVALGVSAAAVISRWQGQGSYEGRAFDDDHRCTSVFVRNGHAWRLLGPYTGRTCRSSTGRRSTHRSSGQPEHHCQVRVERFDVGPRRRARRSGTALGGRGDRSLVAGNRCAGIRWHNSLRSCC